MSPLSLNCDTLMALALGPVATDVDIRHLCKVNNIPFIRNKSQNSKTGLGLISKPEFESRSQLLLLGGPLETVLTQTALSAIMDGFQVFLLVDHILSSESEYEAAVLERLYQSGVSPIVWVQMVHELSFIKSARVAS